MITVFDPIPLWLRSGTTNVPVVRPNLAAAAAAIGGAAWAYGAWTQVAAAADLTGHAFIGCSLGINTTANRQYQFQLGVGGAGAEVVIGTYSIEVASVVGAFPAFPVVPALFITASARVAFRSADDTGGSQLSLKFWFMPVQLP